MLLIGGLIAAVCVIAAISFTVGDDGDLTAPPSSGDDDLVITLPTGESTTTAAPATSTDVSIIAPPTTAPTTAPATLPPTTSVGTTSPPITVAPTTAVPVAPGSPTTAPTTGAVSIESIVPDIAASRRHLATPQQVQTTVDRLLRAGGRHDVALLGSVDTLCATVELAGPIELSGRWERDGDEIAETGLVLRSAPGFGDCIDNDGAPLEPGSYQFIATDVDGTDSAVANFVVGAARLDQRFVNNGEEPVCAVLVAPTSSDFFEDYVFSTPLPPGAAVVIPIADVPQDVAVWACGGDERETLADFDFDPTPRQPQPLIP